MPGSPDFMSGFSVVFVGVLGARGFIAKALLQASQAPQRTRVAEVGEREDWVVKDFLINAAT